MRILTVTLLLLVSANASGQTTADNYISFQYEPFSNAYCPNCQFQENNTVVAMTLWLVRPYNMDFDGGNVRAVENVSGFDCRVTTTEGATILGWETAAPASIWTWEAADIRVRYDVPQPVDDNGRLALATCNMFIGGVTSFELPTEPVPRCCYHENCWIMVTPSTLSPIEGSVSYLDADDPVGPYVAANCVPGADAEIQIYDPTIPADGSTWGAVKELYR
ncbi:MAG: hypothetical protein R6X25_02615 [Candidatus Krumholzibacteriia bacterium]